MAEEESKHWTTGCKGDGGYPVAALIYRKLPWRYREPEQLYVMTAIDCKGRCLFKAGRWWRFYPGKIYPGVVSFFDGCGFLQTYNMMAEKIGYQEMSVEAQKATPVEGYPDEIMLDMRTLEQVVDKCCPVQYAMYHFEGVE